MNTHTWKVGELAEKSGLSVRTLHYYEEIGLLPPPARTPSAHRIYNEADVACLQQITSLRQMGFSLEQIKDCLGRPDFSPQKILEMHLSRMESELTNYQELLEKMRGMKRLMESAKLVSSDDFLKAIALMNRVESYFTDEQRAEIKERGKKLGEEKIIQGEQDWRDLMNAVQVEMEKGTDPSAPAVQKLAKKWMSLVEAFTGGNPGITANLKKAYEENPDAAKTFGGPNPEMFQYITRAMHQPN